MRVNYHEIQRYKNKNFRRANQKSGFFFSNSYDIISHIVIYCPIITCMCAMMRYQ